jgi:predicted Fe-Mo cluster-binding NifX family protein
MTLANIYPSHSLARRSQAAYSSNALEKRGISTFEEENEWLSEYIELLKKLSIRPQTSDEAYNVLESLKDRTEGRPFSEAAWNEIDNTLLETTEKGGYELSGFFKSARDAAFYNLDTGIKLIRLNNNKNWIEFAKNEIKRGIKVSSLDSLKVELVIKYIQLQEAPKNRKEARAMLESRP